MSSDLEREIKEQEERLAEEVRIDFRERILGGTE
jgi:putative transposon-encoded protein